MWQEHAITVRSNHTIRMTLIAVTHKPQDLQWLQTQNKFTSHSIFIKASTTTMGHSSSLYIRQRNKQSSHTLHSQRPLILGRLPSGRGKTLAQVCSQGAQKIPAAPARPL